MKFDLGTADVTNAVNSGLYIVGSAGIANANANGILVAMTHTGARVNGININNACTSRSSSGVYTYGAGLAVYQSGTNGSAIIVTTKDNVNCSTNGLVNYTLSNTQSGATVMQKIDLGTSAQGHTGLLVQVYNASTTAS